MRRVHEERKKIARRGAHQGMRHPPLREHREADDRNRDREHLAHAILPRDPPPARSVAQCGASAKFRVEPAKLPSTGQAEGAMAAKKASKTASKTEATKIVEALRRSNIGKVKVACSDIDGILGGKYIHRDKFFSAV